MQQVLEAEMTSFLGAGNFERSGERRGWRNGFKPWVLEKRVGKLELLVPKDREGQFQTVLFERYRRSENALVLSMLQICTEGVLTRKVSTITETLCGQEVSRSQVSALSEKLDLELSAWLNRGRENAYPYLVIDARYEQVRRAGQVVSQGVLVAVGISEGGYQPVFIHLFINALCLVMTPFTLRTYVIDGASLFSFSLCPVTMNPS